ncbi:hypothetical protein [Falsihalocynthiibacter arcticus]|uniref:Uncharacterized protein n=1 Tax=Falsihalocynthiibacter arcticus TaxID=1579316 RepID=A0A126V2I7_9RHOB|nr:hypothetical protein [Falsihalocynthiibacter arcticus]AML52500.1 hypothetical protein RC74_15570 [Falsihalocynthiibacter arcticus]
MQSNYKKQWSAVRNLWKAHHLRFPDTINSFANTNSSGTGVSSVDNNDVFAGVSRSIKTVWTNGGGVEKMRIYWHAINGCDFNAGDVLQMAFLFKSDLALRFRFDQGGVQHWFTVEVGKEYLFEFTDTVASDATSASYPFYTIDQAYTGGTFWVSCPLFYKRREKITWAMVQQNDYVAKPLTALFDKKLSALGYSMTVNRQWTRDIVDHVSMLYDSNETHYGTDGHLATAAGGITVLPIESANNGTVGSIYHRAKDLAFYAPDVINIFGGINDKGYIQSATRAGKVPVGTAADGALTDLTYVTAAEYTAGT